MNIKKAHIVVSKAKRMMLICAMIVVVGFVGCSVGKTSSANQKLPKKAIAYIKKLGLKDDVASYSYGETRRGCPTLYSMGFDKPDIGWFCETKDSTLICFSPQGEWVYTVVMSPESDLDEKYLSEVDHLKTVLSICRNIESKDIHIVGVSKEKNQWIIAAYKTHDSYMGPPTYHYFYNGYYKHSLIII